VAVIKHTHHELNDENRGDTARFRAAGAEPVMLAGGRAAVVWTAGVAHRHTWEVPLDLLAHAGDASIVLLEGFKYFTAWLHVEVVRGEWRNADSIIAAWDLIWSQSAS
jgi:molybdopterin-guanine dinucleotide biosynthesis protein MobB